MRPRRRRLATMAPVSHSIRALTLDLDDTLWPFAPIGERIEQRLHAWLCEHSPQTAARFPIAEMRALRQRVWDDHPEHAHDLSLLRRLTIQRALAESGGDLALADAAYEIFHRERNRVEFYPDARGALQRISARLPVAALTNGNADLRMIGIADRFVFQLGAREHGAAKPAASLFQAACARLGAAPGQVLHVGDDAQVDILGAQRAGLPACWINRDGLPWPEEHPRPALEFPDLGQLADWLESQPLGEIHLAA